MAAPSQSNPFQENATQVRRARHVNQKTIENLMTKMGLIPLVLPLGADAVLTGSFIWNLLTGGAWTPGDVDVFCKPGAVSRLRECLLTNGYGFGYARRDSSRYTGIKRCVYHVEEWQPMTIATLYKSQDESREYLDSVCVLNGLPKLPANTLFVNRDQWDHKMPCIQLIVRLDEDSELIQGNFDLVALENWWDGRALYVSYPDQVNSNSSKVRVTVSSSDSRTADRIKRYQDRGLTILTEQVANQMTELSII